MLFKYHGDCNVSNSFLFDWDHYLLNWIDLLVVLQYKELVITGMSSLNYLRVGRQAQSAQFNLNAHCLLLAILYDQYA